jgi:uncharacterized membrane protein
MIMPFILSLIGFSLSALAAFVYDDQFGAGVAFATGLAWFGIWIFSFIDKDRS